MINMSDVNVRIDVDDLGLNTIKTLISTTISEHTHNDVKLIVFVGSTGVRVDLGVCCFRQQTSKTIHARRAKTMHARRENEKPR